MSGERSREPVREPGRDERLALLLDTIAEMTSTLDIDSLLVRIVDRSLELTGAERGILVLHDPSGSVTPRVARDRSERSLPRNLAFSKSVVIEVLRSGVSQVHEMALADSGALALSDSMVNIGLRRLMCVPLSYRSDPIGAIYVDSGLSRSSPFGGDDRSLFEGLAQQAAVAIVNARLREAELEKERLQARMRIAGEIQQRGSPHHALLLSGFDVYGVSQSCEETCGDFFDYIPRRENHWGLVVGDVVGHGLEAALYMLTARSCLRSSLAWSEDVPLVFAHLHRELSRDMDVGEFVTTLYVDLDLSERTFRFLAAGHPPPILYRATTDSFESLSNAGPMLGTGHDTAYCLSDRIAIEPGDVLVLYSDGITEARNPESAEGKREMFGEDRLRAAIRARRGRSSRVIVSGIIEDVDGFLRDGVPDDDRTLIVVTTTDDDA